MKNIFIAILAIYYLLVSTGFTFYKHSCMGETVTIALENKTSENCGRCGMKESQKNGCCKTETIQAKLSDNPLVKYYKIIDGKFAVELPKKEYYIITHNIKQECNKIYYPVDKPPPNKTSIYLLIHNFRI